MFIVISGNVRSLSAIELNVMPLIKDFCKLFIFEYTRRLQKGLHACASGSVVRLDPHCSD